MTNALIDNVRGLVTTVRDDLRERREERARYQALKQELASYRTANEIDDLLSSIANDDSADAERMRSILLNNLPAPTHELYRVA